MVKNRCEIQPRNGCDGRLMVKILATISQVNLVLLEKTPKKAMVKKYVIIIIIIITRTVSHTTKYIHQRCNLPIGKV